MEDVGGYNNSNVKRARLQSLLSTLLDDPVLKDVPKNPSVADVDTLISLELGSAMKLFVVRMDNTMIDVAVPNSATVKDLKSAVVKKVNAKEQSQMGHRHISWKHLLTSSSKYVGLEASRTTLLGLEESSVCNLFNQT